MVNSIQEFNIVVDGVSLSNDWRITTSRYIQARNSQGTQKMVGIEFVIEADTEQELKERWDITQREFNKTYINAYGYRSDANQKEFVIGMDDGETVSCTCNVSELGQGEHTRFSKECYLEISCDLTLSPTGGKSIPVSDMPTIEGLQEEVVLVRFMEADNSEKIVCQGTFKSIMDQESIGPITIDDIVLDSPSGFPKIEFATPITPPTLPAYVTITGTAGYNGKFAIHSAGANEIIFKGIYTTDESTGTANVGLVRTGEALYDDNYQTILDLMGVGVDNVTLIHKHEEDIGDGRFTFTLTAEEQDFVPAGLGDGHTNLVASVALGISSPEEEDGWEQDPDLIPFGGQSAPKPCVIDGHVVINRDASSGDLTQDWAACQSDIIARAESQLAGATLSIKGLSLDFDKRSNTIVFKMLCYEDFNDVLMLEKNETIDVDFSPYVYEKGTALHGVQYPNAIPVKVLTRKIARLGKGSVDLSTYPAPTESGYSFVLKSSSDGPNRGPLSAQFMGNDYYLQTRVEVWLRLKLV